MKFSKRVWRWLETALLGAAHWRRAAEWRAEEVTFWRESSDWWQHHSSAWQEVAETYWETTEAWITEGLNLRARGGELSADALAEDEAAAALYRLGEATRRVRAALEAFDLDDGPHTTH